MRNRHALQMLLLGKTKPLRVIPAGLFHFVMRGTLHFKRALAQELAFTQQQRAAREQAVRA